MGFIASLLVYLATFIRLLAFSVETPLEGPLIPVLVLFGFLLLTEPWVSKRVAWYPTVYLIIQTLLATLAFMIPPRYDFLAILFIPLTVTAVLTYGYPAGYYWIGFFTLALIYPMMITWEGSIEGAVMIALFCGLYLLTGSFASQLRQVELSRRENERLLLKLRKTHRELEEYKSRIEDDAAARTRSQMAQELHDSVTQTIFTVNLAAQTAAIKYRKDPASAGEQIDRMIELAGGASQEITDLVSLFRPRSVISEGLPAALAYLAKERKERDHLNVTVTISGKRELPEETSLMLYRIVQEALNNVSRHAGVDRAEIRLDLDAYPYSLEIIDEGEGFEVTRDQSKLGHFGLTGMADRAAEVGWIFTIQSHAGSGTHVRVEDHSL